MGRQLLQELANSVFLSYAIQEGNLVFGQAGEILMDLFVGGKNTILIIMLSYSLGFTQFLHYVASSMQRIMDLHTKHIKLILNYGQAYCEERSN